LGSTSAGKQGVGCLSHDLSADSIVFISSIVMVIGPAFAGAWSEGPELARDRPA
jgi:hypothetical protein